MKILAFMQNPWFAPDTKQEHVDLYRTDQQFHQRLLSRTMSGGRLLQAFGQQMYGEIHWDNASPSHATEAKGLVPADLKHVDLVVRTIRPNLILTFGVVAQRAVALSTQTHGIHVMSCHHPNARHHTQEDLNQFAQSVILWIDGKERR